MDSGPVNIGIPDLTEEQVEALAEQCEEHVSRFIMRRVPKKSIEELRVTCSLDLAEQLDVDIEIELTQKYDTGVDIDNILDEAAAKGMEWLEKQLREMSE